MQGFRDQHRFICKEFSLIDGDFQYHAIVKSPYRFSKLNEYFQRHATWVSNFFHGLTYDCGDVHIVEVISKVYPKIMNKKIIVKEPWKKLWLRYIFRNCPELDYVFINDLGLDMAVHSINIGKYKRCEYHEETCELRHRQCARQSVLEMKDIVETNQVYDESLEKLTELFETETLKDMDMDWNQE